jgi:acyl carrier protein
MSVPRVRAAIVEELRSRGYAAPEPEDEMDLISGGVNSAALIQILSALEDAFDIELEPERLFSAPVTIARLEAEIIRIAGVV